MIVQNNRLKPTIFYYYSGKTRKAVRVPGKGSVTILDLTSISKHSNKDIANNLLVVKEEDSVLKVEKKEKKVTKKEKPSTSKKSKMKKASEDAESYIKEEN